MKDVSIALVHHPVLNKNDETIGSAVTNLDIHDIARCARTYGVKRYYISTLYEDQHQLVEEIVGHWQNGHGATYNPARKEALSIVRLAKSVDEIIEDLKGEVNREIFVVATSARSYDNSITFQTLRDKIDEGVPVLLLLGTAHGLAPEIINKVDAMAEPIQGAGDYNHLSVRSAASIMCDRLLGN